ERRYGRHIERRVLALECNIAGGPPVRLLRTPTRNREGACSVSWPAPAAPEESSTFVRGPARPPPGSVCEGILRHSRGRIRGASLHATYWCATSGRTLRTGLRSLAAGIHAWRRPAALPSPAAAGRDVARCSFPV